MHPADLLDILHAQLSAQDAAQVYCALKRDPLIWRAFDDPASVNVVELRDCSCLKAWSPANLALHLLNSRLDIDAMQADHLPPVEPSIRKKALEMLENVLRTSAAPTTVREAGLIALALRERRRKTQTWQGLLDELKTLSLKGKNQLYEVWKTALACLFGMTPDPEALLSALLKPDEFKTGAAWISHMLLTNPMTPDVRQSLFHNQMNGLPLARQVEWLAYLQKLGNDDLVRVLAGSILRENKLTSGSLNLQSDNPVNEKTWDELARQALELQWIATLHQLAGHPVQAELLLEKGRTFLQHWLTGSTFQLISIAENNQQDAYPFWDDSETLIRVMPVCSELIEEALWMAPPKSFLNGIHNGSVPSLAQVYSAVQQINQGRAHEAQAIAREAIQEWLKQFKQTGWQPGGQFIFSFSPWSLLKALQELGLFKEALEIALAFMEHRVEDIELINWACALAHRLGQSQLAVQLIRQATLLDPENPAHYRKHAELLEDQQKWEQAIVLRRQILEIKQPAAIQDRLALAKCALGGANYDLAIFTTQEILKDDEDHGLANTLLGLALEGTGERADALAYLSKATLLIPEEPQPWLELARIYRLDGEDQRAMETLRAALLNAPESAELHLAIGQACLDNGLAAEALPYLKQSARLAPESDDVALALTRTMMSLGHEKEALEVVERARNQWPAHPGLAYEHARILIERGDRDQGIAVLEVSLQSERVNTEWYVDYARILLNGQQTNRSINRPANDLGLLIKAQKALQKVLKVQPNHFEACLLMAEIFLLRDDLDAAQRVFQQVMEMDEANSLEWYWRIQSGIGLVGFRSGQIEMALASLQNAAQAFPSNLETMTLLAESCYKACLFDAARQAAERAQSLHPNDVDNLIWYADMMQRIDLPGKGCDALRTATQIAPGDISLSLQLAQMLIKANQAGSAKTELERAMQLEAITCGHLQVVAEIAMQMGDPALAKSALHKAVAISLEPSFGLHYRLALLLYQSGQIEPALTELQTALILEADSAQAYILQSDLQARLNRPQAALASLEKALRICESQHEMPGGFESDQQPDAWGQIPVSLYVIHERFVNLLENIGELTSALYHAEKALEACPSSLKMRHTAANLCNRLLQPERMARIIVLPEAQSYGCFTSFSLNSDAEWLAGLQYFKAILLLEQGNLDETQQAIEEGLVHQPDHLRLRAARIRLLVKQGNFPEAEIEYDRAVRLLGLPDSAKYESERAFEPNAKAGGDTLALAEAAFDLFRWQEGMNFAEAYLHRWENDPCSHLTLAQGMVRQLEWQSLGQDVEITRHQAEVKEEAIHQATEALVKTSQLVRSRQTERWQARAEMFKRPISQNIQTLLDLQPGDEDMPWIVYAFLRSGSLPSAKKVAEQCSHMPLVQAMLALAHISSDPERTLNLAVDAVEKAARHPIYQAILAIAAERCGDYSRALEAIEVALLIWKDEIHWHKRAARLAEICGEPEIVLMHLENALALDAQDFALLLAVSSQCLKSGLYERAIETLHKAINLDHAQAQVWQMLAQAYDKTQQYEEALKAVEKAVEIDPLAGESWVLGGEVALRLGDENKALHYARQAEKVSPAEAGTRLLAVRILINRGNLREAMEELNRAIEEIPDHCELALERSKLVWHMQGASAAMELLQPLVQRYPANSQVLALYAQTCVQTGRLKLAEQSAVQALKIDPYQADLHRLLADVLKDQGQLDRAIHHYSEAVRLNTEHIETYLELGQVYVSRREYAQALAVFQQAAQVDPDDYRPFYSSALVLRDGKDYPAAESMLRRAASLAPDDVNIRRQLGAIIALNLVHHGQEAGTCPLKS
ncbi:MAG: tetratricopeptide repeat protein [Chloroflexota bacterium]